MLVLLSRLEIASSKLEMEVQLNGDNPEKFENAPIDWLLRGLYYLVYWGIMKKPTGMPMNQPVQWDTIVTCSFAQLFQSSKKHYMNSITHQNRDPERPWFHVGASSVAHLSLAGPRLPATFGLCTSPGLLGM